MLTAIPDPDFEEKDTLEAQTDWTKSTLHAFLRGARPSDPESQREANQVRIDQPVFSLRNTLNA
jgi:actin-related protein 5